MTSIEDIKRTTDPITLTRFLLQERNQFTDASGSFTMLLQSVQLACKVIANAAKKAGIANLYGVAGGQENSSGDVQKKLDVLSNDVFINCMKFSGEIYVMGSEENEDPIIVEDTAGGYAIVFDPLDGSSNIDANVSVGTIFGIYKKDAKSTHKTSVKDLLKSGDELIAAGYALYGSATNIVLTTGLGVNCFTLDPTIGEFILTHADIKIPKTANIYSVNEGNFSTWDAPTQAWVNTCKRKRMKARYVGSMVADVHRTLLYGGIFAYPADCKNTNGKLRLLYECNPIAFLMEQAGGSATTGTKRIMAIQPTGLHERVPIFCGSPDLVAELESFYRGSAPLSSKL